MAPSASNLNPSKHPTSPSSPPPPASLQSREASSSSISLELSRPPSRQSSRTSHSSPPTPESAPQKDVADGAERVAETTAREEGSRRHGSGSSSGSTITASSAPPPAYGHDAHAPSSSAQQTSGGRSQPTALFHRMQGWISRRQWFGNSIGFTTLVATLVGLLIFGYRSYKLDIHNSHMSYLQVCLSKAAVNATVDPACRFSVAQPVPPSPYKLIERAINVTSAAYARMIGKRDFAEDDSIRWQRNIFLADDFGAYLVPVNNYTIAGVAFRLQLLLPMVVIMLMAVFLIKRWCKKARVQEVFSSPARNQVRVTRHHPDQGQAVTSEHGVRVIKHKPEEHHYLGQLRDNLRHVLERDPSEEWALGYFRQRTWKSVKTGDDDDSKRSSKPESHWGLGSESTLVSGWDEDRSGRRFSSVTIQSSMGGEDEDEDEDQQYEGLIELKTKGSNKTFFDPKTGEFIRLTPWKASAALDDDDSKFQGDVKGNTKKALARMGAGAVALGGGKSVDEEMLEELDRDDILGVDTPERIPQRPGDTMAGLVTNEQLTGKLKTM